MNRSFGTKPELPNYMFFIYKHMKFRIPARLCLAIYEFEARIILRLCSTFQDARLPVWEKFNSSGVNIFLVISVDL